MAGSPSQVEAGADDLARLGRLVTEAGDGIRAAGSALGGVWSGEAADAARGVVTRIATTTADSGDALGPVGPALMTYAHALREAQAMYAEGEATIQRAVSSQLAEATAPPSPARTAALDTASRSLTEGEALQQQALEKERAANADAAATVRAATAGLGAMTLPAGTAGSAPTGEPSQGSFWPALGNAAASAGNAMLNNPTEVFAVLAGGTLATVSAAGAVGSVALDATGVGAVGGIPLGAASAAGVVAGVGIAGAGAIGLATKAAGPDRVQPFQVNEESEAAPPPPFAPPHDIRGLTKHGEEQAESRNGGHGVSDEAMEDAVKNPESPPTYRAGNETYLYRGKDASVSLNDRGEVVTTWPRSSKGHRNP